MREIKFRAWDKDNSGWITDYDTGNYSPIEVDVEKGCTAYQAELVDELINGEHEQYEKTIEITNIEVMQYTGLKDKNGKEIFEGDIFNYKRDKAYPGGGYIAGTFAYHPESAEVVTFENGCFMAGTNYLHNRLFWYERHNWQNIGNIYDNPELLKDDNEMASQ